REKKERFLRPDGSRMQPEAVKTDITVTSQAHSDFVLMEHDLRVLSDVKEQNGTRVVIYESPIHPEVSRRLERNLGRIPLEIRATLRSKSKEYGFEYFRSPDLMPQENGPYWSDFSHAPAGLLGEWITQLVSTSPSESSPVEAAQ
ncbi:MAG: hypothetical protein MI741_08760, partial [Rhodospirillales bacterium]|nr:hypothetical protein [Rhodospirillales bacterium]